MKTEDDSTKKQEIIQRAMAFPMDKVLFKYRKDKDLSNEVASQHEREIKRFLALTAISDKGKGYAIRGPIDALWHTFILFTKIYERFCREVAGRFIHHFPNISGFESVDEYQKAQILNLGHQDYARFLRDYEANFDEPPPEHLWPRPVGDEFGVYAAAECASDDCGNTGDD